MCSEIWLEVATLNDSTSPAKWRDEVKSSRLRLRSAGSRRERSSQAGGWGRFYFKRMDQRNKPLGVLILGGVSCFGFGLLLFILSITALLTATPEDTRQVSEMFDEKGLSISITHEHFKIASAIQAIVSVVFFVCGRGLLLGKDWARKLIIYFSFGWGALIFITSLLNPSFMKHLIVQMVYPGVLIIYFTNKKVEQYFLAQR